MGLKSFISHNHIALLLFIIFFLLYCLSAPSSPIGYADADEFITLGYKLGLAHPPGYSLYIILLYVFTHLPLPLSIALKANLLSSLLHSLTLVVTYLGIKKIIQSLDQNFSELYLSAISAVSVALLGVSYLFWLYGSVAEKYSLNDFLISLSIYAMITIATQNQLSHKFWYLLAISLGLGWLYHPSQLLLIPMMLAFFYFNYKKLKTEKKKILGIIIAAIGFQIGLMIFLNHLPRVFSWNYSNTLGGLFSHLSRLQNYQPLRENGTVSGLVVKHIWATLTFYLSVIWQQFGAVASLLMASGLGVLIYKRSGILLILLTGFIFFAVLQPLYLFPQPSILSQGVTMRHYLSGFIFFPFLISLSLWFMLQRINSKYMPILFLVLLLYLSYRTFNIVSQVKIIKSSQVQSHYASILDTLPKDSLLLCQSDTSCFILFYLQQVEAKRPDILIVPSAYSFTRNYLQNQTDLHHYQYQDHAFAILDLISWNIAKRPIYVIDLEPKFHNYLGLNYGLLYYLPLDGYGQLTLDKPKALPDIESDYAKRLLEKDIAVLDKLQQQSIGSAIHQHQVNAEFYARYGDKEKMDQEIQWALKLSQKLDQVYPNNITSVINNIRQIKSFDQYLEPNQELSVDNIHAQALKYLKEKSIKLGLIGLLSVQIRDPENPQINQEIHQLMQSLGYKEFYSK